MDLALDSTKTYEVHVVHPPALSPSTHAWVQERERHLYRAINEHPSAQAQIAEMRKLSGGWLDGTGEAPSSVSCDAVVRALTSELARVTVSPQVYPTPEGGVQLEWLLGNRHSIVLHVLPDGKMGEVRIVDAETKRSETKALSWNALAARIGRILER